MPADHYATLDVPVSADTATIRAAYLALMRELHPDRRPGDPDAMVAAQRVNAAWTVLRDPRRRAEYDRQRFGTSAYGPVGMAQDEVRLRPPRAYSEEYHGFRRDLSGAILRVGFAAFAVGLLLLVAIGG